MWEMRVVRLQFYVICILKRVGNDWIGFGGSIASCDRFQQGPSSKKLYEIISTAFRLRRNGLRKFIECAIWFNNYKLISELLAISCVLRAEKGQRVNDDACTYTPD